MKAIYKHELKLYMDSLYAWVFSACMLVFIGIAAVYYNISNSVSNFEYVLGSVSLAYVALVPLLSMRLFAEERKQKTEILLYSLPISTTDIVLGKYFAMITVLGVTCIPIAVYPLIFKSFGDVYLPTSYGSLFAFILLGCALLAAGMFISSLTENQGLAAAICVVLMLFFYYCSSLADKFASGSFASLLTIVIAMLLLSLVIKLLTKNENFSFFFAILGIVIPGAIYFINADLFEGLIPNLMDKLSVFERFYNFVNGIFDLTGIVYFLCFAAFFVFLTVQSLEKRRYS